MGDGTPRPRVLVLCGRRRDRELIGRMLASVGADGCSIDAARDADRLVEEDRIDLVLADSSGDLGLLGELLRALDAHPTARDLPLILLGDASDVGLLADLTTRRFNATLLAKPVEPTQLAAAVQVGAALLGGPAREPPADGPARGGPG